MDERRARRLVEARLGRAPQDALEAAVVLEAWAGVPAQRALELARGLLPRVPEPPAASATRPPAPPRSPGMLLEGAALLVTILAIALWAEPLGRALGVELVADALTLALPLTLACQSALRARHLGRPCGLAGLARRRGALAGGAAAVIAAPAIVIGPAGALAGLLTVTWTAGTILLRRGWALAYAAIVGAAAPVMLAGAPAQAVVIAVTALTTCVAAAALRPGRSDVAVVPGRWSRTAGAALTGAGLGALLVADPTVGWTAGAVTALALLPSAAGGLWAGHYLWRLADAFPRALSGVPACGGGRPSGREPAWTLLGAAARLVALTVAGSAALLLLSPWLGRAGVLAGFGVVALAGLLVALLESLGRPAWAALGVGCGVATELAVQLAGPPSFPGAALVAGGALAVAVLLPAALLLLARPARTLATALWIT